MYEPTPVSPVWLDGGMATSLQALGLPERSPVETWLRTNPEAIAGVHRAFIEAGAELLLTATFRSIPGVREDWADCIDRAIPLARAASPRQVWLSLGPGGDPAAAVQHAGNRVDGVVLETFVDPNQARDAVRAVRRIYDGPLVASLVPLKPDVPDLRDEGLTALGLNCVSATDLVRALDRLDPDLPVWAKPNGGPDLLDHASALRARCRYLGGCCGTSPEQLAALITWPEPPRPARSAASPGDP